MNSKQHNQTDSGNNRHILKILFAAELFSKLPEQEQDTIIAQIEALLSHE